MTNEVTFNLGFILISYDHISPPPSGAAVHTVGAYACVTRQFDDSPTDVTHPPP